LVFQLKKNKLWPQKLNTLNHFLKNQNIKQELLDVVGAAGEKEDI
jgi:hypothetical protein